MSTIFFTGFPGFLGSQLLPRLLGRGPHHEALCLVQSKFAALAASRVRELEAAHPQLAGRIRLVEGDITRPLAVPTHGIHEIFHLAAIYDLAVKREVGMRINVEGTRHVLNFAERCAELEHLHYVSTCYVSGRYDGTFRETDLDVGQRFNNYYEETKFLAERDVRERMGNGLAATIYRPSVIVGDSTTGATQKFDGPYFVMQWLLRQPRIAVLPVVGRPSRYHFNVVPRDFIVDAINHLSAREDAHGKCYALADPDPMTVDETINAIGTATHRKIVRIPLTFAMGKGALEYVPGMYRLMRIPPEAVNYFVHPTTYDTSNATQALMGSYVSVPRFRDYLPRLVEFAKAHPEVGSAAMA